MTQGDTPERWLVHFGEIGLKGKNRPRFERALARNLRHVLGARRVVREYGRMIVEMDAPRAETPELLARVPGVRYFARAHPAEPRLEHMREVALRAVCAEWGPDVRGRRFRVRARRADKRFPHASRDIEVEVGGFLRAQCGLVVDLDDPEIPVVIEVAPEGVWVYARRHEGAGGLPVGVSGRGVALFSGGLDSPVAAWRMMKRGMRVVLVHFYNSTLSRDLSKIERLAAILSRFQGRTRLLCADLEDFQRHAVAACPPAYRMIVYKRQMLRVAARIARLLHAQALVTGDSLGQVASQTLANIAAIYAASDLPVLSPLIGADKEEIVAESRRLGLYETAIEEHCDICAFMLPKHPETRADPAEVAAIEAHLPLDAMPPVAERVFDRGERVGKARVLDLSSQALRAKEAG